MDPTLVLVTIAACGGVALLPPVVLGGSRWSWAAVGASALVGFALAPAPLAGALIGPWLVGAGRALAVRALAVVRARRCSLPELGELVGAGFLLLAGAFALDSCVGRAWFGYGEPIARLTAVHFTFIGVGAIGVALGALAARPGARPRQAALVLLAIGPLVVALGFATGAPLPQIVGPVLVSAGAFLVASAQLRDGVARRSGWLVASGLAVWAPMALALAWALAPHTGGPALSIDAMVPLHGGGQALGFVGCGLLGRRPVGGANPSPAPTAAERATLAGAIR